MTENNRKIKLSDEYPVINVIKTRMKKDENFSKDQVRDFERKASRTYSNMFLIKMLQEYQNAKIRISKIGIEKSNEIKHLETCISGHAQKYQLAEQRIIEKYGKDSEVYKVFRGY